MNTQRNAILIGSITSDAKHLIKYKYLARI